MGKIAIPSEPPLGVPALVAHRGYALHYPENTIESLRAAIHAGTGYVEFDVQLTADRVPVLLHDPDLWRTGGEERVAMDLGLAQLRGVEVNEDGRLRGRFKGVSIPTLEEAVALLRENPAITAFVEIKGESVRRFGSQGVVERLLAALSPVADRCVVISSELETIKLARELGASAIGLVPSEWSQAARAAASRLAPEYLLCNYLKLPDDEELWPGRWRWVLYEVTDPELALALAARGAHYIETMAIGEMLSDKHLVPERRSDD